MTSLLSYLHDQLKVTPLDNDQVQVTVTLPSDLFRDYIRILDSLTGFARTLQNKSRLARSRSIEDDFSLQEGFRLRDQYYARLVVLFDQYTAQGLNRSATIKQISSILRKEKHPWSSADLVRSSLIAAGRGGHPGRPRRLP